MFCYDNNSLLLIFLLHIDMLVSKMGIKKNAKKIDLTEKTRTAENLSEAKIYCEHDQKVSQPFTIFVDIIHAVIIFNKNLLYE